METKRRTGPSVWAVLLTLGQPAVWLYLFVAASASDACSSADRTGICDPDNQVLSLAVPFLTCSAAVLAAWLVVALASTRWQGRGVAACWAAGVVALGYSWQLVSDVPGGAG